MRNKIILISALLCASTCATAQVSLSIGTPNVSIGINLPQYPDLEPVPGYPVYYAPGVESNYFFYDGYYWVYQDDNWYASEWYNGPWDSVDPQAVPIFVLRVPVRYYRRPPAYFRAWRADGPPRWDQHWGARWAQQHRDWDHWDRRSAPRPAPLPTYQRQYSGPKYPDVKAQKDLHSRNYQYHPHEVVVHKSDRPQPHEHVDHNDQGAHDARPSHDPVAKPRREDAKPAESKDRGDRPGPRKEDRKEERKEGDRDNKDQGA